MGRKVNYRLKILEKLSEGPKKFNELRKTTGSSEATIFRHLKRLEKEGRIKKFVFSESKRFVDLLLEKEYFRKACRAV